jgi:hypothetical protein
MGLVPYTPLNILDKLVTLLEWVWLCPPWNILNKLITHLNEFGSLPHRTFQICWLCTGIGWLRIGMGLVPSSHWTFSTGWLCTRTPCLMHMCVISTMFGSCFSFFSKLLSFFIFYFYAFSIFIIILYNKNKMFLFHFCIFVYSQIKKFLENIENLGGGSEEEEIEIPKSKNSSRTLKTWGT